MALLTQSETAVRPALCVSSAPGASDWADVTRRRREVLIEIGGFTQGIRFAAVAGGSV